MKKVIFLALVLLIFFNCGEKGQKVKRYMVYGVEIVENGLEPYKIKGEPSNLVLEQEFRIDAEDKQFIDLGLNDIDTFDIDSEGSLYLVSSRAREYFIFKFNKTGDFVKKFGRKGQGPGEFDSVYYVRVNEYDQIIAVDLWDKYCVFSKEGDLVKDRKFIKGGILLDPLENGDHFKWAPKYKPSGNYSNYYSLCDAEFKEIKDLDVYKMPNKRKGEKRTSLINPTYYYEISNRRIYIINEQRGYEILVYDFGGHLLRKIRKKYRPVLIPDENKERWKEMAEQEGVIIPDYFPPFNSLFTDDKGRIYVMTYEKGETKNEYIYDIFNSEGLYIGRKKLGTIMFPTGSYIHSKKDRAYCLQEKENGYKELVVYKMRWK